MFTKRGTKASGAKSSGSKSSGSKSSGSKSSGKSAGSTSSSSKSKSSESSILQLYCAIYRPRTGNYYHWAFAINDETARTWRVFEVIQDENDDFHPNTLRSNPLASNRCLQPLTWLGAMHGDWLEVLVHRIQDIQVPGESFYWNCQDYVMEIWHIVGELGMVDPETYEQGQQSMMPFYGQDYGGQVDEAEEAEEEEEEPNAAHFLSEEFVYDSDS